MLSTFAYEAAGAGWRPAFPAPSAVQRGNEMAQPGGKTCRGNANACLPVIARSENDDPSSLATQASQGSSPPKRLSAKAEPIHGTASREMDCFASLAMTVVGCLKTESSEHGPPRPACGERSPRVSAAGGAGTGRPGAGPGRRSASGRDAGFQEVAAAR